MSIFILADCSLNMSQKTYSGVTKLDMLRSISRTLIQNLPNQQDSEIQTYLFTSDIHMAESIDSFVEQNHLKHIFAFCNLLTISPMSNLFESLKTVLKFKRFLQKTDLAETYSGNRLIGPSSNVF